MRQKDHFYLSWIVANTLAEAIGLGFSMILGFGAAQEMAGTDPNAFSIIFAALLAIILGIILEGVLVGVFQANIIQNYVRTFKTKPWVQATAAGAGLAWFIGMLPSTIIALSDLGIDHGEMAASVEPSPLLRYGLAAGLGFILGPVLAAFQVRILKRHTRKYLSWLIANAFAWAAGMVLIFLGMDLVDWEAGLLNIGISMIIISAVAGAVVGAIHGLWLRNYF